MNAKHVCDMKQSHMAFPFANSSLGIGRKGHGRPTQQEGENKMNKQQSIIALLSAGKKMMSRLCSLWIRLQKTNFHCHHCVMQS
jgi:hypothetical protein